jgi:hypothetical protein
MFGLVGGLVKVAAAVEPVQVIADGGSKAEN